MRRIGFSGLILALTLGAASIAAAQEPTPAPQQPQAQQQGQWGQRGRFQRAGRRGLRALFRGVNLTAQQKEQIKAINQKYAAQTKPIREAMRPAMQEMRDARQKGDQNAARAVFERTKPQREQLRQIREQELKDVRAILTPDQQKTFDQNAAQLRERMQQWQQRRQQRQQQRQGA